LAFGGVTAITLVLVSRTLRGGVGDNDVVMDDELVEIRLLERHDGSTLTSSVGCFGRVSDCPPVEVDEL
jgi:hypothetical protein